MPQVRILSLRPKNKREARPLFCFLLDVSIRSCFAKQNAGSHSPLGDRQARLSGVERGNHGAKRSYPVTPTKIGFGKQFSKPFSLFSATQILRADDSFSSALALCYFGILFLYLTYLIPNAAKQPRYNPITKPIKIAIP